MPRKLSTSKKLSNPWYIKYLMAPLRTDVRRGVFFMPHSAKFRLLKTSPNVVYTEAGRFRRPYFRSERRETCFRSMRRACLRSWRFDPFGGTCIQIDIIYNILFPNPQFTIQLLLRTTNDVFYTTNDVFYPMNVTRRTMFVTERLMFLLIHNTFFIIPNMFFIIPNMFFMVRTI